MRCTVLKDVNFNFMVLDSVASCNLVNRYQCFEGNDHRYLDCEPTAPVMGFSSLISYQISLSVRSFPERMETASFSKTLFPIYQTTRRYMPEDCDPALITIFTPIQDGAFFLNLLFKYVGLSRIRVLSAKFRRTVLNQTKAWYAKLS